MARKGRRQKLKSGEWDWVSLRARKVVRMGRGMSKWLKKCMNRRARREKIDMSSLQGE